jgi:endonuclease/exonuclease/phosphatase family metal-dependent hydrolase
MTTPEATTRTSAGEAFGADTRIAHDLAPDYALLRRIRSRKDLVRHDRYASWKATLDRVLVAIERGQHACSRPASTERLRVVAWNIHRGMHFDELLLALQTEEGLHDADVLLLSEVDNGMARSGHRNVARELAERLGMHYAFGVSYLVLGDDLLENTEGKENTLALAGQAILSRHPLTWVENVGLAELKDKFSSRSEKRLGKKRALLAGIDLPAGPLVLACCHLDSNASPRQRATQLDGLLERALEHGERVLLGGDLNTTTYDASGLAPLMRDLARKYAREGIDGTMQGYMKPEVGYERPLFETLERHGFRTEEFNDRRHGTIVYDTNDPYTVLKLNLRVGRVLTWLVRRRLRAWGGICQARLDWFAGRGVTPLGSKVVLTARQNGTRASDHAAVVVDIAM